MRIFHAELASNPAFYAFGYSTYAQFEDGDRLDDCYAQGFVPFVGAVTQPENMLYMARGARVRVQEYKRERYQRYAEDKLRAIAPTDSIICTEYERANHPDIAAVANFMLAYFHYRFGKASMPRARLEAILASPLMTHIVTYQLHGETVGYLLETRGDTFTHLWYYGYLQKYEKNCLGLHIFTDFVERAKKAGKTYAYLGSTYGNHMRYKSYYRPLEYWNGEVWVDDPKGKKLKQLLASDSLRHLAFSDSWRETHQPYYESPYPFTSVRSEIRYLWHLMYATPRAFGALLLILSLVIGGVAVTTLFP